MSEKTLLKLNKLFRLPQHPFNTQAEGGESYAQWQFSRAESTLALFEPEFPTAEILGLPCGKVLDLGCGAAGKSVWYAVKGACVTAVDTAAEYRADAEALAAEHGVAVLPENAADAGSKAGSFRFVCADAAGTGLPDASFDSIIISDAMEHFADPEGVLAECARLLRPGGRVFISFPPYGHPYGAHVSDLIGIPWVQLFFSDADIIAAYRTLAAPLPDAEKRINLRFSRDSGSWRMSYINKMTLRRFAQIRENATSVPSTPGPNATEAPGPCPPFRCLLYREVPLRGWLAPLAKVPGLKEKFVRMAVCVLQRS